MMSDALLTERIVAKPFGKPGLEEELERQKKNRLRLADQQKKKFAKYGSTLCGTGRLKSSTDALRPERQPS